MNSLNTNLALTDKVITVVLLLTNNQYLSQWLYTYTLAWGFFFEKSQAKPKSEIRTWPFSSSNILAGWKKNYAYT